VFLAARPSRGFNIVILVFDRHFESWNIVHKYYGFCYIFNIVIFRGIWYYLCNGTIQLTLYVTLAFEIGMPHGHQWNLPVLGAKSCDNVPCVEAREFLWLTWISLTRRFCNVLRPRHKICALSFSLLFYQTPSFYFLHIKDVMCIKSTGSG
jgi:hypothetical protein